MRRVLVAALALCCAVLAGCAPQPQGSLADLPERPSFSRDVAPLVHRNCAPCHHPGGSAPFSLLSYRDVKRRSRQIATLTEQRYMPPWLPAPGPRALAGERRLEEREIALLARWHEQGAPEGDPAELPEAPEFPGGWQLGEPDLIVRMEEAYDVPLEGLDVFRSFVLPVPGRGERHVRAVELLPGNPRVVHHAIVQVDVDGSSRRRDALDDEPGYEDMFLDDSEPPDGHFVGWTPGRVPSLGPADQAWPLPEGADLVLQLHLLPTGRPEKVQVSLGLHLSDEAPTRRPYVLLLRDDDIDIAAGRDDFAIEDSFRLPVDVELLVLYPHAHYLGKDLRAIATLPDGSRQDLLWIPDWDFNWQDEYRFVEPVALPAGTELSMAYRYDNSASNPRNPHEPPRRVRYGGRSTDEMGTLTVQLLTRDAADRAVLEEAWLRRGLLRWPDSWAAHHRLASLLLAAGRTPDAIASFREAVRLNPAQANTHHDLGLALSSAGDLGGAEAAFRQSVGIDPRLARSHYNLGLTLRALRRTPEAIDSYHRALLVDPDYVDAHQNLGVALASMGRLDEAVLSFGEVLTRDPQAADARLALGKIFAALGRADEALLLLEESLQLRPNWPEPMAETARLLATHPDPARRDPERARRLAEAAVRLAPGQPRHLEALAAAQAAQGRPREALATAEQALELARRGQASPALVDHLLGRVRELSAALGSGGLATEPGLE